MKKIIHIHAKCKSFEIFENVDEDKSIRRLKTIRDMFNSTGTFYFKGGGGKKSVSLEGMMGIN